MSTNIDEFRSLYCEHCRQYSVHPMTGECRECGKSTNDPVMEDEDE